MRERFFSLCILLCLLDLPIQKLILKLKKKKKHKTVFKRANSIRKSAPSFPGGSLVKNVPASVRRHRFNSWSEKIPNAAEELNQCTTATEPVVYLGTTTTEPPSPRARALQQEKPLRWEACAPQLESRPCLLHLEKSSHSNKDPAQSKIKK